ncbi:hypothetical protein ACFQHW_10835 [Lapidilactobacillus achengensis]|uniref:Integral membrane protein n=1 Tax=Lapidilactobacillus achengensis TaxID=2486000 RepID=A0ABW1US02_9LACO|nr:hypothetical protein [Lapidilactobacillus achengensis]
MEKDIQRNQNKGRESIFYHCMTRLYAAIKLSLVFWVKLVQSIFTLRMFDSLNALFQTNRDIREDNLIKVRKSYLGNFKQLPIRRKMDLSWPLVTIYFGVFVFVPFPSYVQSSIVYFVKYVALILLVIWQIIVMVPITVTDEKQNLRLRDQLWIGFSQMCSHAFRSILLVAVTLILSYFALKNTIFLIFFFPGILALLVQGIHDHIV